jgi:hypothetical protein
VETEVPSGLAHLNVSRLPRTLARQMVRMGS